MHLDRIDRKYWLPCTFTDGTEGAICKDGLLYMVDTTQENKEKITAKFPTKNEIVWYFNTSMDRECAENHGEGDRITLNPSAAIEVFGLATFGE
jgi:hypothetical protein